MTTLSLPSQFEIERLKRYLQKHPEEAVSLAIAHFHDYLELVSQYRKLEKNFRNPSVQSKLQSDYLELLRYCIQLQTECANLHEDNQALKKLMDILAPDLPLSQEKERNK